MFQLRPNRDFIQRTPNNRYFKLMKRHHGGFSKSYDAKLLNAGNTDTQYFLKYIKAQDYNNIEVDVL